MHAHIETVSRDCDGEYRRGHIEKRSDAERQSPDGVEEFRERVIGAVAGRDTWGTLLTFPSGANWDEATEEGYIHTEVRFCDDDCEIGDNTSWSRDLSAEKAGY